MRATSVGIALLVALGSLPLLGPAATAASLGARIAPLVEAFPGRAGIWVSDPAVAQPLYARDGDRRVITASLYKLAVMAAVEDRVERGLLRYSDRLVIEHEDITADGSFEPPGTEMTIDEALEAMITLSDNGTAVHFWRTLGGASINALLAKSGITNFRVAESWDEDNVATPRSVATLLTKMAKGELVSRAASQRMLARLERQHIRDRIPAQLPEGVRVANKTGDLPGMVHDAGIVFTPLGQRVIVAMTWDTDKDAATRLIAHLASTVHDDAIAAPASARYRVPVDPQYVQIGSTLGVDVVVENSGEDPWPKSGPRRIDLTWELRDAASAVLARAPRPIALGEVRAGGSVTVPLALPAPKRAGDAKLVLSLVDGSGRGLTPFGVATATVPIRVHLPFVAQTAARIPSLMHRREASLIEVAYTAYEPVRWDDHSITLGWRFIDPATGRIVAQGQQPLGTIRTYERSGTFFAPLVAPNVRGTYHLEHEIRERGFVAGVTQRTTVEVLPPRSYADDIGPGPTALRVLQQRGVLPTPTPRPAATPRRTPLPTFVPATSPRPAPRPDALP